MANLDATQALRLASMAGEGHKDAADRMLDDAALDVIVGEVALLKDSAGVVPGGAGYATTVDMYRAAAEAWRRKAGMVADGYDFKAEGASFSRSQMFQQYLVQAARYANMAGSLTVEIARPVVETVDATAYEEWLAGL